MGFGKSTVVADAPCALTVHLPAGCRVQATEIAKVRTVPSGTKTVEWKMIFDR